MIQVRAIIPAISAAVAIAASGTLIAGCGPKNTGSTPTPSASTHAATSTPPGLFPPTVNEGVPVSGPVSGLRPATPIMVGDNAAPKVCLTGFYIDYPDTTRNGEHFPAFITAAQCAQGNDHALVAVMKASGPGQNPVRTQIGQITYVSPGDQRPAVADAPWTIPTSPLAVLTAGQPNWALPVEVTVNGKPPASTLVQSVQPAEQGKAPVTWTNSFGEVVTGHVLDPAATPEIRDIPSNIERVVVAADDPSKPIVAEVLGSPVTVDLDGTISNLGIITGTDAARHWVVVDLIGTFLAAQGAHLAITR